MISWPSVVVRVTFFNVGDSQHSSHDLTPICLSTPLKLCSYTPICHFCSSNTELLAVPQVVQYSMSLCLAYLSPFICPNPAAAWKFNFRVISARQFPCQPPHSGELSYPPFSSCPAISHSGKEPRHEMELDSNPGFPNFLPMASGNIVTALNFTVSRL